MRLLFVSHSFSPVDRPLANIGGMQRVAMELHDAFNRAPSLSYAAIVLRSTWAWVHWKVPLFLGSTWWLLRRHIRRGDVDVVLFSSMVTAALAVPLLGVRGRDRVVLAAIVHGLDVTTPFGPYQRFIRTIFDRLDLVLPVSQATGEACVARGLGPDRLRPVRNGVDLSRFPEPLYPADERRSTLDSFGAPPAGSRFLVSVGRHVRRKGFEWFVREVMPILPVDFQYWIAGEGPETPSIARAVEQSGLGARVRLLGRLSENELRQLLQGADLFIMPNVPVAGDMEGFGVVILEAGLSGLPSVGARLEGVAEVVTDGQNGSLVPSGDREAFSRAILAYYEDPETLAEASRRARRFTMDRFGWDAVAAEYVEILKGRLRT